MTTINITLKSVEDNVAYAAMLRELADMIQETPVNVLNRGNNNWSAEGNYAVSIEVVPEPVEA